MWPTKAFAERRRRGRSSVVFILAILAIMLGGCAESPVNGKPMPKAVGGTIDLMDWSWAEDGVIPLDGEWSFQWIRPHEEHPSEATTLEVPATWGNVLTGNDRKLDDQGYGVYWLRIIHREQRDMMALRLPNISTAYELSIDGNHILSRGRPGMSENTSVPYQSPATVYFNASDTLTDIQLTVSNFDHRRGGIRTEIVLGDSDHIQKVHTRQVAQELIVLGCLIMIGFYHLGLFLLRRQEIANLLFALLCLFVGMRMGLIGEGFIVQWLEPLNWTSAIRLEYIAFVMSGWAGFGYFQAMYSGELKRIWFRISSLWAALLCIGVLTVKPLLFSSWILLFQSYVLFFGIFALAGIFISAKRGREGARLALIGVAGLVLTVVNDMLFYNGWWRSIDLVPFGLLFLIVMNSFIISLRFSRTYERAERMSTELIEWNSTLEGKIAERTEELQRSYATLADAKLDLERMEQSRTQLVSNISHDLRTPITLLQGYLEALRDNVISEPSQRDHTIRSMLSKVEGLNSLIQDLFELSVLEARKVELAVEDILLADWIERLTEQYGLEMETKQIAFDCELNEDCPSDLKVGIDIRRMDRVFANLLYNAIRYTAEGGRIRIAMNASEDRREIEVTVTDNGTGIAPEDLPHIFDRFYKKDKSRNSSSGGSGLGLSIAKEIVELHGGRISAFSPQGGGCEFRMVLPAAL